MISSWMTSALADDPQLRVTAAVGSASDADTRGKSETSASLHNDPVRHGSKWESDFARIVATAG